MSMLMESTEGQRLWKAESDTKHVHLQCALEYQSQHGLLTEARLIAGKLLGQLQPIGG